MNNNHFTDSELQGLLTDKSNRPETLRRLSAHLLTGCEECREALARFQEANAPKRQASVDYSASMRIALERALEHKTAANVEDAVTNQRLATELLELTVDEARERIRREPQTFRDPRLLQELLEQVQSMSLMDPPEVHQAGLIVRSVIDEIGTVSSLAPSIRSDLEARTEAHLANANRLKGQYGEARTHFQQAYAKLETGTGDPLSLAEILHLEGSLLRDQRHFDEAIDSVREAFRIYRRLGDHHRSGRCLVSLALIYRDQGDAVEAAKVLRSSLELLDFNGEPMLEPMVQTTLALYTAEAGKPEAALEILRAFPVEEFPTRRLRLFGYWRLGLVLSELKRYQEAAETLGVVYTGFAELGEAHNTALAALDLALAFAHQGDAVPVQHLAHDALRLLEPLNVPRDTYASLLLFQRAAHTQRATVRWIQELKSNLSDPRRWRIAGG
ncbi:MAG: tetratricopeptide repeat protein [Acidobacteriota bacterium]|nr:tetratricopeptide repeat protein [Acidobacteriota bacterium]